MTTTVLYPSTRVTRTPHRAPFFLFLLVRYAKMITHIIALDAVVKIAVLLLPRLPPRRGDDDGAGVGPLHTLSRHASFTRDRFFITF